MTYSLEIDSRFADGEGELGAVARENEELAS